MNYKLRILPAADADVDDAALFIARDNLATALKFYDAVDQTYRLIREHPNRWPRYELDHPDLANLHKRSVVKFDNYLIFYRIEADVVEIVRVLHAARDIPSALADDLFNDPR
ncbi:MAG: type II toxin-antitoxin system RelE/ParE family toxin [Tepidisphaeraceae bacterium]|jgi:toxin ParE1/3/4